MTKDWKVHDEIYTMIWYYDDKLKELKDKRHDLIIELNKLNRMIVDYPTLNTELETKKENLVEVEEELNLTKSLLRRLRKLTEMYSIQY